MPYKDLEHDGVDIFALNTRESAEREKDRRTALKEEQEEKHKEIAQEAYMNLENPLLWDGEI